MISDEYLILIGKKWLDSLMEAGGRGADIRGVIYWSNLYQQKVSSSELLIRLAGLWYFDFRDHLRRYIKNHRHLIRLSGNAVIRFGKMYGIKYVPPKYYRQVGDQVKRGIGTLLVNISRSVEKAERKQRLHISKMGQELNIDGLQIDE